MSYFNKQTNWKFFIDDIESLSSGNILNIHNDITLTGNLNISNSGNYGIKLKDDTFINDRSSINNGSGTGSGTGAGAGAGADSEVPVSVQVLVQRCCDGAGRTGG